MVSDTATDPAAQAVSDEVARVRVKTVITLLLSQVCGSVGVSMAFTISSLVAISLSHSATKAGVAQGVSTVGTVAATLLLAKITSQYGRRPGLTLGYLIAAGGAVICALAIARGSFLIFVIGGALFAVGSATNFQARFAASDLAVAGRSATGISLVVWMSTAGAIIGPNLAALGGHVAAWVQVPAWSAAYGLGGLLFLLAATAVVTWLRPDPLLLARRLDPDRAQLTSRRHGLREGARAIAASGTARFALGAAAASQAAMIAVMTWTPVHMSHAGSDTEAIGLVLSGHLVGMYALSPLLGWLSDRYGTLPMVAVGGIVMITALVLASRAGGMAHVQLGAALWLLGLSWALMFISGSGLFTESVAPAARAAAQGIFDLVVWTSTGVAGLLGGWIVDIRGFAWLSVGAAILIAAPTVAGWLHLITSVRARQGAR